MKTQPHRWITLRYGKRVAVDEYGDRNGAPVFFCHGWPASRTQALMMDDAALELGLRLISPDRPGIGQSDAQPKRTLRDWPPLLREIAAALGVEKFAVLGVSGGAPYALASAWALPEMVSAAAIVCGAPPIASLPDYSGLLPIYRVLLRMHRHVPRLVRLALTAVSPIARVHPPRWSMPFVRPFIPIGEARGMEDPRAFEICFESYRASWGSCASGVAHDAVIYAQPWGFSLGEIRVPVEVWHGIEDQNFAFTFAEQLARELPHASLHLVKGDGHFSLPFRRAREILSALKTAAAPASIIASQAA